MKASTKLRTDYKLAVDHIKDRVMMNVTEARRQGMYRIEEDELGRLINVINAAFDQGFSTSAAQIEKSIEEVTR